MFTQHSFIRIWFSGIISLNRFGDNGGGVPHVPIPNTTVKPSSADGTWTAGSRESRTSRGNREKSDPAMGRTFLCSYEIRTVTGIE